MKYEEFILTPISLLKPGDVYAISAGDGIWTNWVTLGVLEEELAADIFATSDHDVIFDRTRTSSVSPVEDAGPGFRTWKSSVFRDGRNLRRWLLFLCAGL